MQNRMEIGDKVVRVGDNLRANKAAQSVGICHCGNIVKVIVIDDDNLKIGVYSEKENVGWGNLDGIVSKKHGFWMDAPGIFSFFETVSPKSEIKIISKDFNFKKRNLKGMSCKILHQSRKFEQSFVELTENVGGGSADGLGKMGHCIVLPHGFLSDGNTQPEEVTKKKEITKDNVTYADGEDQLLESVGTEAQPMRVENECPTLSTSKRLLSESMRFIESIGPLSRRRFEEPIDSEGVTSSTYDMENMPSTMWANSFAEPTERFDYRQEHIASYNERKFT